MTWFFLFPVNKSNLIEKELYEKFYKYELKLQIKRVSTKGEGEKL